MAESLGLLKYIQHYVNIAGNFSIVLLKCQLSNMLIYTLLYISTVYLAILNVPVNLHWNVRLQCFTCPNSPQMYNLYSLIFLPYWMFQLTFNWHILLQCVPGPNRPQMYNIIIFFLYWVLVVGRIGGISVLEINFLVYYQTCVRVINIIYNLSINI